MTKHRPLLIWGASDHAEVVAVTASQLGFEVIGFVDRDAGSESHAQAPVLDERAATRMISDRSDICCFPGIGDNAIRSRVLSELIDRGNEIPVLIDPRATVQVGVELGAGTFVGAGAVVVTGSELGRGCIVNTGSTIDHHSMLGDSIHVAPGSHLGGRVVVGEMVWIGIGATVSHGVRIGKGTIVGAGAVVVDDLPSHVVAFGVPANVRRSLR